MALEGIVSAAVELRFGSKRDWPSGAGSEIAGLVAAAPSSHRSFAGFARVFGSVSETGYGLVSE